MLRSKALTQVAFEWQYEELNFGEEILKLSLEDELDKNWWILNADVISTGVAEPNETGESDGPGDGDITTRSQSA
jgi:hypothetical protein